jgi:hypothetical protein
MNKNKKDKTVKVNKAIENMGNSTSIHSLDTVSDTTGKNNNHKNK